MAKKEKIYLWDGKDEQGNVVKKRECVAKSKAAVKIALRREGKKPTKIRKLSVATFVEKILFDAIKMVEEK